MRDYIAEANRFMYDDSYIIESEIKVNGKDFPTIEQGKAYLKKLGLKNDEIEKKIELGRHLAHSYSIINKHQSLGDKTDKHEKTVKYDSMEHGDTHNNIAASLRKKKDVSDEDVKKLKDHNEKAKKVIDLASKEPEKKENPKIAEIKKKIADLKNELYDTDEDDDHRILQLDDAISEYQKDLKELEAEVNESLVIESESSVNKLKESLEKAKDRLKKYEDAHSMISNQKAPTESIKKKYEEKIKTTKIKINKIQYELNRENHFVVQHHHTEKDIDDAYEKGYRGFKFHRDDPNYEKKHMTANTKLYLGGANRIVYTHGTGKHKNTFVMHSDK